LTHWAISAKRAAAAGLVLRGQPGGDEGVAGVEVATARPRCWGTEQTRERYVRVRPGTIEEKVHRMREVEQKASAEQRASFDHRMVMSWIHHDNALEGVIYEPNELVVAMGDQVVSDSTLIPVFDEIRQYKAAIDVVRQLAAQKKQDITLDTIKDIYFVLAPEEVEPKALPKYRKDMPIHRVYFHEISTPDKIPAKMRELVKWLGSDDVTRTVHPTRIAARAHYQFLHVFPFPKHSGKVARLLMNLILIRGGYPPAILHSTDRQRYYDALKTSSDALASLINEALDNGVESATRYWHRELGIAEETIE
jgi:Fic family protein